jgi:hypothetical protein
MSRRLELKSQFKLKTEIGVRYSDRITNSEFIKMACRRMIYKLSYRYVWWWLKLELELEENWLHFSLRLTCKFDLFYQNFIPSWELKYLTPLSRQGILIQLKTFQDATFPHLKSGCTFLTIRFQLSTDIQEINHNYFLYHCVICILLNRNKVNILLSICL